MENAHTPKIPQHARRIARHNAVMGNRIRENGMWIAAGFVRRVAGLMADRTGKSVILINSGFMNLYQATLVQSG